MVIKTKIFVGKLPPNCEQYKLQDLFETYGEVTECSIMGNYAFVHMKTEDQASSAIKKLNNTELDGYKISVEQSTGEKRGGGGEGRGGGRGRGMGRGFAGGPMRGRGMGPAGPYDRRGPMSDRFGPPPPRGPPMGPPGPPLGPHGDFGPPIRNGYYDEFDSRERRPMPMPREPYRDPYDRYDPYDRMALSRERMPPPQDRMPLPSSLGRRSPPPPAMERRSLPIGYGRRDDPFEDAYGRLGRDPYPPPRSMFSLRDRSPPRRSPPRMYPGLRDLPPRRF